MQMRTLIPMLSFMLAACDGSGVNVSSYEHDPKKRQVNIDDHTIYVVPISARTYVAWGGAEDRDGFVQYRQRRGIEMISHCRVSKLLTKKNEDVLRAEVKC